MTRLPERDKPQQDGLERDEPERDEPLVDTEHEEDIINDEDDEPDDEDIPLVDATENRR